MVGPKGRFLSNAELPLAKIKQQLVGGVIVWTGIANKTTIGLFKVNEKVKLNSDKCDFIYKTLFE